MGIGSTQFRCRSVVNDASTSADTDVTGPDKLWLFQRSHNRPLQLSCPLLTGVISLGRRYSVCAPTTHQHDSRLLTLPARALQLTSLSLQFDDKIKFLSYRGKYLFWSSLNPKKWFLDNICTSVSTSSVKTTEDTFWPNSCETYILAQSICTRSDFE